uniref:DUF4283 domain-containing protein n=1 Tax=Lactuca sativa TaxID=4236 RepID=A0A9R1WCG8_LACSA|nr:hypothetical protein LSAT_V11C200055730 [Lactuca sativa]
MLLEFEDIAVKEKFLIEGREIWQPWFKSVSAWEEGINFNERIESLIIQGVPQHAWCEEAFSIIASKWGSVVIPEECNTSSPNLAFGRVGILTSHPEIISSSIKIMVDGKPYQINIMEDIFESLKLSPVLAANDFYQKMSWWDEDSIGENGSFNSDAPALHEVGGMSPVASPTNGQQSQEKEFEQAQANIPCSGSEASPSLHKDPEVTREKSLTSDAGSAPTGALSPLGLNRIRAFPSPVLKKHRPTRSLDLNRAPARSFPSVSLDQIRLRPPPSMSRPHSPSSPSRIPPSYSLPNGDDQQLQGISNRSPQMPLQSSSQVLSAESNATSWEVAKTIAVGESVGFLVSNQADRLKQMIKSRGVTIIDQ